MWSRRRLPSPAAASPAGNSSGRSCATACGACWATSPPGAGGAEGQRSRPRLDVPALLGRGTAVEGIERDGVPFGEYLEGDAYLAAGLRESDLAAPAVVWVHPMSCPLGYVAPYRRADHLHHSLAQAGFVTFCYDQIGCGRRIEEAELFAARHPRWSLLGKMVRDCRAAIAAASALPYVNPSRVWLLGFDTGALVALHAAALDERVHGLALASAPASLRGSALPPAVAPPHLARDYQLLPRLSAGDDQESQELPYDVPHLLASVAPLGAGPLAAAGLAGAHRPRDRRRDRGACRLCAVRRRRTPGTAGARGLHAFRPRAPGPGHRLAGAAQPGGRWRAR